MSNKKVTKLMFIRAVFELIFMFISSILMTIIFLFNGNNFIPTIIGLVFYTFCYDMVTSFFKDIIIPVIKEKINGH